MAFNALTSGSPSGTSKPESEDYLDALDNEDVTFESFVEAARKSELKVNRTPQPPKQPSLLQSGSLASVLSLSKPKQGTTSSRSPPASPRGKSPEKRAKAPTPKESKDSSPNSSPHHSPRSTSPSKSEVKSEVTTTVPVRPKTTVPDDHQKLVKVLGVSSGPPQKDFERETNNIVGNLPKHLDESVEELILKSTISSTKAAQMLGKKDTLIEIVMEPHLEKEKEEQIFQTKVNYSKAAKILGESEMLDEAEKRKLKLAQRLGDHQALAIDAPEDSKPLDPEVETLVLATNNKSAKALQMLGETSTITELHSRPHLDPPTEKQVYQQKVGSLNKAAKLLGDAEILVGQDEKKVYKVGKLLGDSEANVLSTETRKNRLSAQLDKDVEQLVLQARLNSSKAAQLLGEKETMMNQLSSQHLQNESEKNFLHSKYQIPKAARILGETQFLSNEEKKDYKILKQLGDTELIDRKTPVASVLDPNVETMILKTSVHSNSKAAKFFGEGTTTTKPDGK